MSEAAQRFYDRSMRRILEPFRAPVEVDAAKLHEAQRRGRRAQELLNDSDLKQAFEVVEGIYLSAWRLSAVEDVAKRERCHIAVSLLTDIKGFLKACVENGDAARSEIEKKIARDD